MSPLSIALLAATLLAMGVTVALLVGLSQQGIAELYQQLAESFVLLMDLLQTIRQYSSPSMAPIAALELWHKTGSQAAYDQISDRGTPLHESMLRDLGKQ